MAPVAVNRPTAMQVIAMIRDGKTVKEIASELNVSEAIISVIEHSIALREGESTQIERLQDLARENIVLSQNKLELRDYVAKQLAKWLIQAGLQPGQIHIATGLTIHKCRHLYKQVRSIFETENAVIPMPTTLVARVVMSIFTAHYLYLQEQSGTTSVQINNVIVAWTRTIDEVFNYRIDEMPKFDRRIISLGSLFEVARGLREVKAKPGETIIFADGKAIRKIARSLCPVCGSYFVSFIAARRAKASQCCFCEMVEMANADTRKRRRKAKTESVDTAD